MNKYKIIAYVLMAITIVLAVISYLILPDSVMVRFVVGSTKDGNVAKWTALMVPTLLGVGGGLNVIGKDFEAEDQIPKGLMVSAVGILVFVVTLIMNR